MKPITREMIKTFELKKWGCDFMGYTYNRNQDLSFHHLIVPRRKCKECGLGEGYLFWNGAILNQDTSHDYLHIIEQYNREMFLDITYHMVAQNKCEHLTKQNLIAIRNILLEFEKENSDLKSNSGRLLIKRKYTTDRIDL